MAPLEPWVAGLFSCLASAKEGLKGPIDSLQRPSTDGDGKGFPFGIVISDHRQAFALIEIGDRGAGSFPGITAFLQSSVVQLASHVEQSVKSVALSPAWKTAVFVSSDHGEEAFSR